MLLQDDQIKAATEEKMREMRYGYFCGHFSCSFLCANLCIWNFGVLFINVCL